MRGMTKWLLAVLATLALTASAMAQEATPATTPPAPDPEAEDTGWEFGLSAALYVLPDEEDFLQPTFKADRGLFHFETRYNYEDRDSVSFFAGANFEFGDKIKLALTPMIGGLVGTDGWHHPRSRGGPHHRAVRGLRRGRVRVRPRRQLVELLLHVVGAQRVADGVAARRGSDPGTRVYRTERDIQRGLLVGVSFKRSRARSTSSTRAAMTTSRSSRSACRSERASAIGRWCPPGSPLVRALPSRPAERGH